MSFEYDVFISYAHLDDRSPTGDAKGWIDLLYQRLSVMLSQALGEEVRVWRDERSLQGNDELGGAISEGVTRSLLFVPVVSPRYVKSDWCQRELRAFHESTARGGAAAGPGFRKRVFKVKKTPLLEPQRKLEPEFIGNLTGYEFYGEDEETGALVEFGTKPDDKNYWKELTRLVSHMTKALIELKYSAAPPQANDDSAAPAPVTAKDEPGASATSSAGGATTATSAGKFVYVAQTTSDLKAETQAVRDELVQRGHHVLPEEMLPLDASCEELSAVVRGDLARCALSVHLVGARYGSTTEDDGRSVVQIQEELAAEREQADASFLRLLWTPAGLSAPGGVEVTDKRQREFVAGLQNRVTARTELLQASVEELKTRIVEKLNPTPSAVAAPTRDARRSRLKHVYLICELRDRPLVRPIREYLFKHKFEVITWFDEGAGEKLTDYHRKNLKECDAALIYFGNADETWVRKNLEDLEKAYGYGREDDWAASAVYVGAPFKEEKEDFLTHMAPVIRNVQGFNPEDLSEFVSEVERADEGGPRE